LERHLTSTGTALVAVQGGSERAFDAGASADHKAALFEHTMVANAPPPQAAATAPATTTTAIIRVTKRVSM
jgi:hypothetical protein